MTIAVPPLLKTEFSATAEPRLRSEEHTSELQSLRQLVCRLLLEKKKRSQASPQRRFTHLLLTPPARRPPRLGPSFAMRPQERPRCAPPARQSAGRHRLLQRAPIG